MRVQVQFFGKDGEPGGRRYTYDGPESLTIGAVVGLPNGQSATVVALTSDYDGEVQRIGEVREPVARTAEQVRAEMAKLERAYVEGNMNPVAFAEKHDALAAELHTMGEGDVE